MISWRLIKAPLRIARSKGEGKNIGEKKRGYNFDHVEKEMLGHEIESVSRKEKVATLDRSTLSIHPL